MADDVDPKPKTVADGRALHARHKPGSSTFDDPGNVAGDDDAGEGGEGADGKRPRKGSLAAGRALHAQQHPRRGGDAA